MWLFYKFNEPASDLSLHHRVCVPMQMLFIYIDSRCMCAWKFFYNVRVYLIRDFWFLFFCFQRLVSNSVIRKPGHGMGRRAFSVCSGGQYVL